MKFDLSLIQRFLVLLFLTAGMLICNCARGQYLQQDENNLPIQQQPLFNDYETIARPLAPLVFSVNTFNSTCGRSNGGVAVSASNGTAPYQYKMNNVTNPVWGSSGFFGNLSPITYKVYAKDAMGIIDSVDVTITNFWDRPTLTATDLSPQVNGCDSLYPALTLAASGGQPPYMYSYDFINMQSSPVFTNLYEGVYNLGVIDANGCRSSYQCRIENRGCHFGLGGGGATSACGNLMVRQLISAYNNIQISVDGGPEDTIARAYGAGLHTFLIRDTFHNISKHYVYTALNICTLKIDPLITQPGCNGQNGAIKLFGNYGRPPYLFSNDGFNFSSTDSFYNLAPGTHTYAIKDANGNVAFVSVALFADCPALSATTIPVNCSLANGSIKAAATRGKAPYVYSLNGAGFQSSGNFAGLAAGNYMVIVKDSLGFRDTVAVTVQGGVCFAISATPVAATCTWPGRINASSQNGVAPVSYSLDNINYQFFNSFSSLPPGNYKVYGKSASGVIDSVSVTVPGAVIPKFSLGSDTILCRGTLQLKPDTVYANTNYVWSNANTSSTILVNSDGDYWLKATSAGGCVWMDTVSVTYKTLNGFNLGSDTSICEKDTLTVNATAANASNYLWSNNATSPQIKAYQQNWYWCDVTKDGCVYRDSLQLTVKLLPVVNLGADTILCEGDTLQLNAYNDNSIYQWQDNSAGSFYTVKEENIYSVTVNKDGCIVKDTIGIDYTLKPNFTLGNNQLICTGQSIILKPVADNTWQFLWQDGSTAPSYTVTKAGTYSLEASNTCGSMTDEILFTEGLCNIYIPSAFTPNGDRWNNEFKVSGTALVTQFHLQVFNRYGQLMFETADKNKGWDGLYKTQPAKAGAYVYVLQYKASNKQQVLRGSFLLLR